MAYDQGGVLSLGVFPVCSLEKKKNIKSKGMRAHAATLIVPPLDYRL